MILEKANVGVLPKFYLKMNYRGYLVLDYLCGSYNHFHIKEKINVHRHAKLHPSIYCILGHLNHVYDWFSPSHRQEETRRRRRRAVTVVLDHRRHRGEWLATTFSRSMVTRGRRWWLPPANTLTPASSKSAATHGISGTRSEPPTASSSPAQGFQFRNCILCRGLPKFRKFQAKII